MDKHASLLNDKNNLDCCRIIRHGLTGSHRINALAYSMTKTTLTVAELLGRLKGINELAYSMTKTTSIFVESLDKDGQAHYLQTH
jgi:hypothetical protein